MENDLVIVKSRTINNESVSVVFKEITKKFGEITDVRELSRSYIFRDFQAEMLLKHAEILVKQNPKEFRIVGHVSKKPTKIVEKKVERAKEQTKERDSATGLFMCEYCGKNDIKSRAGKSAHIRYSHPEEWKKLKEKKE